MDQRFQNDFFGQFIFRVMRWAKAKKVRLLALARDLGFFIISSFMNLTYLLFFFFASLGACNHKIRMVLSDIRPFRSFVIHHVKGVLAQRDLSMWYRLVLHWIGGQNSYLNINFQTKAIQRSFMASFMRSHNHFSECGSAVLWSSGF